MPCGNAVQLSAGRSVRQSRYQVREDKVVTLVTQVHRSQHAQNVSDRNDEDLLPGWLGTDNEPNIVRPDNLKDRMSKMKVSTF